jgi:hypothetical protein
MAAKYTPGPWWTDAKYDGREMGCAIIAARTDAGPLPGNPTRGVVAFASAPLNTEARQCEANARLITAAPDLLEAARLALAWTEHWMRDVDAGLMPTRDSLRDRRADLAAAISKATGEA